MSKDKKIKYVHEQDIICSVKESNNLIIRLPIEFNIFGKLKDNSKRLLLGFLRSNVGLICYNMTERYNFNCCIKDKDIIKFIDKFSRKKYAVTDVYDIAHCEFGVYKNKQSRWSIAFNLSKFINKYCEYNLSENDDLINFVPIKHNIYGRLDPNDPHEKWMFNTMEVIDLTTFKRYKITDRNKFEDRRNGLYKIYAMNVFDRKKQSGKIPYDSQFVKNGKMIKPKYNDGLVLVYSYTKRNNTFVPKNKFVKKNIKPQNKNR